MSAGKSLDALRREIDRIDTEIHDLIQRRTEVVEAVRDIKKNDRIKIRPSREDEILYRLVARHRGNFPKRELTRIWREVIVATLSFEGPFTVAVHAEEGPSPCWDLARDQYGSFTPMLSFPSARRVIEAVHADTATVGVLPLPRQDDAHPWWPFLATDEPDAPRIIARLPFAGPGNSRTAGAEALVVSPVDRQPTGRDRSFFIIETADEAGLTPLAAALREAGLPPVFAAAWHDPHGGPWFYLIELEGFVTSEERAFARFTSGLDATVNRILGVGGYGTPLSAEELAPVPAEPAPKTSKVSARKSGGKDSKSSKSRKRTP